MSSTPKRSTLAVRGLVAVLVLGCAAVATIAGSAGAFRSDPVATSVLPAAAGPIRSDSPVQYRGVTVGRLADVQAGTDSARLTFRLDPARVGEVPAGVHARLLPRTLFGDQYIELALPQGSAAAGALAADASIPADTSTQTVQLYQTYTQLYGLLSKLEPAKLEVALGTLADTLRGRGAEIGALIDKAADVGARARPQLDGLGPDLETVATLGRQLAASTPDLLATMDNAVAVSDAIVAKRDNIGAMLSAGIGISEQSQRLLADNGQRLIELTKGTGPIAGALGAHPNAFTGALDGAARFGDAANRAFSTGRFNISAALTLDDPYPYTAAECPRYPGMDGPNCAQAPAQQPRTAPRSQPEQPGGGTAGPVGSPQEKDTMRELGSLLPQTPQQREQPPSPDLLGILLGPLVRGTQVSVP